MTSGKQFDCFSRRRSVGRARTAWSIGEETTTWCRPLAPFAPAPASHPANLQVTRRTTRLSTWRSGWLVVDLYGWCRRCRLLAPFAPAGPPHPLAPASHPATLQVIGPRAQLILVTTGSGVLFSSRGTFSTENAKGTSLSSIYPADQRI